MLLRVHTKRKVEAAINTVKALGFEVEDYGIRKIIVHVFYIVCKEVFSVL